MKKQLARVFLSLIMVLSVSVCMLASAKSTMKVCTSAADLGEIVMDGYNLGEKGSVQIIEGTYTSNKGNILNVLNNTSQLETRWQRGRWMWSTSLCTGTSGIYLQTQKC